MEEIIYKKCSKCGEEKPITNEYFSKSKKSRDGFKCNCKKCDKKYREINKEQIKEYNKKYNKSNPEYYIQYRAKNYEKRKEYNFQYYHKNIEVLTRKHKENCQYYQQYYKKYQQENRKNINLNYRKWAKVNRLSLRIVLQKRRANKKHLPNSLTQKQWEIIKSKFNNKCAYCGQEKPLEQEHFIPLLKGGEYTTNNIIPSCRNCNAKKHIQDFFKWYPQQEFYSKKRESFILKYLGYKEYKQQLKLV